MSNSDIEGILKYDLIKLSLKRDNFESIFIEHQSDEFRTRPNEY